MNIMNLTDQVVSGKVSFFTPGRAINPHGQDPNKIDPRIRNLVSVLFQAGYSVGSCCQGHQQIFDSEEGAFLEFNHGPFVQLKYVDPPLRQVLELYNLAPFNGILWKISNGETPFYLSPENPLITEPSQLSLQQQSADALSAFIYQEILLGGVHEVA